MCAAGGHRSSADMEGPEFSCEDMEFFATWHEVTIIPNFSGSKMSCICVRLCGLN